MYGVHELLDKPLAFNEKTKKKYVKPTSRFPILIGKQALNVEIFEGKTNNDSPILLMVHGLCESIETKGIQALVTTARTKKMKVACLELEGMGFSSTDKDKMRCGDFEKHLSNVLLFIRKTVQHMRGKGSDAPYFIVGNGFGGILCLYAAELISRKKGVFPDNFKGVAAIAPIVSIKEAFDPSLSSVVTNSLLSSVMPFLATELSVHESTYNCPDRSIRNYYGKLPLTISKMLFDLTTKVHNDIENGELKLVGVSNVLIFGGNDDKLVPIRRIEAFFNSIKPRRKLLVNMGRGHDMLHHKNSAIPLLDKLYSWVEEITDLDKENNNANAFWDVKAQTPLVDRPFESENREPVEEPISV